MIKTYRYLGALATVATLSLVAQPAAAANTFSTVSTNLIASFQTIPGLLSALCYMTGIILVILGVIKIKEHMEKPDQTPLKEGITKLVVGGALLVLPFILSVVAGTVDAGGTGDVTGVNIKKVQWTP
jgi:hypothetical protein